jgi:hypothetical protein
MEINSNTNIARLEDKSSTHDVAAEIAIVGAGIGGISAALECARLGHRVILIDGQANLGGQSVMGLIGTFCGLFSNGPKPYQVTHGIADEILAALQAEDAAQFMYGRRNTCIVQYDDVALARWIEKSVEAESNIQVLTGAVLRVVKRQGRKIESLSIAHRFGDVRVSAEHFIDASGDAAVAWQAGLACREPEIPVLGTNMFVLEGVNEDADLDRDEVERALKNSGPDYGLERLDGFVFAIAGTGRALVNMTHLETPLDPLGFSAQGLAGRAAADRVVNFLQAEFPAALGQATVRNYGQLGVRQTRWITGRHHMTVDEVRAETRYDDAILRCSWPIELHHDKSEAYWEVFDDDHMHYAPLRSMTPDESDNLIAVGRCIDGDVAALASVRVMGPCIAMGAAAAHAIDLAGAGSVHQVDIATLQGRLSDNLERTD